MQREAKPSPKRILLISGNYYPELTGIGKYNGEMIDRLANYGYDCTVVTSYPYYPYWKVQEPYCRSSFWYKKETRVVGPKFDSLIQIHRCPQYVPSKPSGIKRAILDLTFFLFSFLKVLQLSVFTKKYDYIITIAPSFQLGLLGLFYKMIKGGRLIYHIQDLQIDAASELQLIKSNKLIHLLLKVERFILKNADVVSSISTGMIKRIKAKHNREVVLFPNWVDTNLFYPIEEKAVLKKEYNFSPTDKIVLYSGAIGEKQGLESIIDTAKALQHHSNLKFIICGSGPYKETLRQKAESFGLHNINFLPLQPLERLNHLLNIADIHLVLQKSSASDLVMPSKLSTILSVGGLAIVSGTSDSALFEIISSNKIGVLIDPNDITSLSSAIENVMTCDCEYIRLNARKYAEEFLSTDKVFSNYMQYIN